jgi:hypothetical protein
MAPPPPTSETFDVPVDFPTPLLSEWIKRLDSGSRGKDGHSFTQFLPAYELQGVVRLLDFYRLEVKHILRLVAECNDVDYMHYGTAQRLHDYAQADVKQAVQRVRAGDVSNSGWPGFDSVHEPFNHDSPTES